jgi:hypothetical protein
MVDYDGQADRASNAIERWIREHRGQALSEPQARELKNLVGEFERGRVAAANGLDAASKRYTEVVAHALKVAEANKGIKRS